MTWPTKFDPPSREAVILVPKGMAVIQDLGPLRTGIDMETDILPGSALVCASENGKPIIGHDGMVRFAFEGNAIDAVNLRRFYERCQCAAGRLATQAPSIAYGEARPEDLVPVARFDLANYVFNDILDAAAIEAWCGEKVEDFLPPTDLQTPTHDPVVINPLCALPMKSLSQGRGGIFAWMLMDGTILTKDGNGAASLGLWRRGDKGLDEILGRAGVAIT
jgi:hypothetical protein